MNNSAIYDRFIDMFLQSADDFEPYGAIAPEGCRPERVARSHDERAGEAELLIVNGSYSEF